MVKKILQRSAPVLREIAKEVPQEEIKSLKIKKILGEMKASLESQDDGVAIAAPQIGYSLRIFVVSKRIDGLMKEAKKIRKERITEKEVDASNPLTSEMPEAADMIFINPVIKKISKEKKVLEEGCLSVRYLYGKVSRSNKATVEAFDENGKKFIKGGSGLLAQIFQHEIDHLDGVLFIDKARELEEMPPEHLKHSTVKRDHAK